MFDGWRRERKVRKVLKRLAKQRVATILQPGDVWVVEKKVSEEDDDVAAALRTCHMRGWVEIISEAVPEGNMDLDDPTNPEVRRVAPVYRLTAAGWNAINRSHAWAVSTFVVVSATLAATLIRLATG